MTAAAAASAATEARRRYLAPEVIQASAMDCGPATVKCLLEGFGRSASYGRLREACQTEVDGTSIDTLEDICRQLGLDAQQVMLPADHLLLPEARALPAIVVIRNPSGLTHFVVAWRRHRGRVQVMDPASGRRWPSGERFLAETYRHKLPVPARTWRGWAGSDEALTPLRARLHRLGVPEHAAEELVAAGVDDPGWRSLAALDAAVRLAATLVASGGIARGEEAARAVRTFFHRSRLPGDGAGVLPPGFWMVTPEPAAGEEELVLLRGVVLVRVRGELPAAAREAAPPLPPQLRSAVEEPPARPLRELLRHLREDGRLAPAALGAALIGAAAGVIAEALLLRGFLDLGRQLGVGLQRLGALVALLAAAGILLLAEGPIAGGLQRLGRHLEARFRIAFLDKLPRLGDRYFRSRLASDMGERCHSLHLLRQMPVSGGALIRRTAQLALTTAGILWLDPGGLPLVLPMAAVVVALPFLVQPPLVERDLKVRSHAGALSRFYLDALLGLVPIRSHGAEGAVRREHQLLVGEWVRAGFSFYRTHLVTEAALSLTGFGFAAWVLFDHLGRRGQGEGVLLLLYWLLNLPVLGRAIAAEALRYPVYRNVALRLTEPLGAPDEAAAGGGEPEPTGEGEPERTGDGGPERTAAGAAETAPAAPVRGVSLALEGVTVQAAGHTILEGVDLTVAAGEQVAIVGRSGAGKSTLVGLFLGWQGAAAGRVLVDGEPLEPAGVRRLRRATAWIDPSVQLWNRSLLANLLYGSEDGRAPLARVVEEADLRGIVEELPEGLQTPLGEGGALLSGGQGQRVRIARGLVRPGARLAILDESFRGLDRGGRRELLRRARRWWRGATLLCVTHDVRDTEGFDRVVVMEAGRVAEDGPPERLRTTPGSRYRELLEADLAALRDLAGARWRRCRLERGRIAEADGAGEEPA